MLLNIMIVGIKIIANNTIRANEPLAVLNDQDSPQLLQTVPLLKKDMATLCFKGFATLQDGQSLYPITFIMYA